MEELKTSPRLHYRAGGICRLPRPKPVCASSPSLFPPPLNVSSAFSSAAQGGVRGALNAKYALRGEVVEWGPPGDILSLHTARPPPHDPPPIRELGSLFCVSVDPCWWILKDNGMHRQHVNCRSHSTTFAYVNNHAADE